MEELLARARTELRRGRSATPREPLVVRTAEFQLDIGEQQAVRTASVYT